MTHSAILCGIVALMVQESIAEVTCPSTSPCPSSENISGVFAVGLLQTKLLVKPGDPSQSKLPTIVPLARSLVSEDPEAAAEHMVRYYNATRVATNLSIESCGQAVGVELHAQTLTGKYTILFVKDAAKNAGMRPRGYWENVADNAWRSMMAFGEEAWQSWMDFHDGLSKSTWDLTNAREDNLKVQTFILEKKLINATAWRDKLPKTSFVLEFDGSPGTAEDYHYLLGNQLMKNLGRFELPEIVYEPPGLQSQLWKKATYAVAKDKLESAFNLSRDLLGIVPTEAPFPGPRVPDDEQCQTALWGTLQDGTGDKPIFELHLVASSPPFPDFAATRFHEYQAGVRNLEKGCFDHYLYNSLILWTESLDPFVKRLQEHSVPFLALRLADELYSITFSLPGSEAMTFDIRSSQPSSMEHTPFDPCRATECGVQ